MVTVNGYTAERMKEIEDNSIVGGNVVGDDLILTKYDGTTINAGNVRGFPGISDMALYDPIGTVKFLMIAAIPTGYGVLNASVEYEGVDYPVLAAEYLTGAACVNGPCAPGKFRLPDMRGMTPFGLHPGITAFNTLLKTGGSKDAVVVTHTHPAVSEQDGHNHTADQPQHNHGGSVTTDGEHSHGVGGDAWDSDRIVFTYSPSSLSVGTGSQEVTYTHIDPAGAHFHGIPMDDPGITVSTEDKAITTTVNAPVGAVSGTDKNLPPYRVGNWIMRLG